MGMPVMIVFDFTKSLAITFQVQSSGQRSSSALMSFTFSVIAENP